MQFLQIKTKVTVFSLTSYGPQSSTQSSYAVNQYLQIRFPSNYILKTICFTLLSTSRVHVTKEFSAF